MLIEHCKQAPHEDGSCIDDGRPCDPGPFANTAANQGPAGRWKGQGWLEEPLAVCVSCMLQALAGGAPLPSERGHERGCLACGNAVWVLTMG